MVCCCVRPADEFEATVMFVRPNDVNIGAVVGALAAVDDCDDNDDIKADGGGVNEPLLTADAAAAVTNGHGVADIDDCMVELRPFGFCCCFSFSGITIRLG